MKVRFQTSIADAVMGEFVEGRVITIDPAAPDFKTFQQWLKAGVIVAVREGEDGTRPSMAPERTVAVPAPRKSRGGGHGPRSSASERDPASRPKT